MLYALDFPQQLVFARIVARNLAQIGLDVQVKALAAGSVLHGAFRAGEPVDIVFTAWTPDYIDPFTYLNAFFESRFIGGSNNARFDSPLYDRSAPSSGRPSRYGSCSRLRSARRTARP